MKIKFYLLLLIITSVLYSCNKTPKKPNSADSIIESKSTKDDGYKPRHNFSLSDMKKKNEDLINKKSEEVVINILKNDIESIYKNADTSMTNSILVSDLLNYFDFIRKYYGSVETIKEYGSNMTAEYKSIDYIANLSTGDSLKLNNILVLEEKDAKLTYLGFEPFENIVKPSRFSIVNDIMKNVLSKNITNIYKDANSLFKNITTENKLKSYLEKYISNEDKFIIKSHFPLIFEKNKIGVVSYVDIFKGNLLTNKVKIVTVYKSDKLKLEDIQFNSVKK